MMMMVMMVMKIFLPFKEQDLCRTPHNDQFILILFHLSKIRILKLIPNIIRYILWIRDDKDQALLIKSVNFVFCLIMNTFHREIFD
jgi:hypothetical protein